MLSVVQCAWVLLTSQGAQLSPTRALTTPPPALISETPAGGSSMPVVSADGRYVAFISRAPNLVTNPVSGNYQIFLRDLTSTSIVLVSVTPSGAGGNDHSMLPSLSSNGLRIAFESEASDLVPNDTNGVSDIFVRAVPFGVTLLVARGNGPSRNPIISANARYVAFESRASDFLLGDTNRASDVFISDLSSDTTALVSINAAGTGTANRGSELLTMTPDGRFVAFWSDATDVFTSVTNTIGEVYVRDVQAGVTYCLTRNIQYLMGARRFQTVLTPDGRYAALQELETYESAIPVGGEGQVFRADVLAGSIRNIIGLGRGGRGLAISDDGSRLVFLGLSYTTNFYFRDMSLSTNRLILGAVHVGSFQVAGDFQNLFFTKPVTNGGYELFRFNLLTEETVLLSTNALGQPISSEVPSPFSMDAAGATVAFETAADDLGPTDQNRVPDIFVSGTGLVAPRDAGLPERTGFGAAILNRGNVSADGSRVAFATSDSSLVANDTNKAYDVFVADLKSNVLISVNGVSRSNTVIATAMSADGGSLLFQRLLGDEFRGLSELDRADLRTGEIQRVFPGFITAQTEFRAPTQPLFSQDGRWLVVNPGYLSDLRTPPLVGQISNQIVDIRYDGTRKGNGDSSTATISLDGEWAAFSSLATDLIDPGGQGGTGGAVYPPGIPQAFARNIRAQRTRLLSFDDSGSPLAAGSANPVISANARFVVFETWSGSSIYRHDLYAHGRFTNDLVCMNCSRPTISGDGRFVTYRAQGQIYVRDVEGGVTEVIGGIEAKDASISIDGRFVAYAGKQGGVAQIFLRDRWTATTHLISRNYLGTGGGNLPSAMPVMSHDGRTIAFQSFASDLVPGDYNGRRDIFVVQIGPVDADGDGLDDDWEQHYFGSLDRDGSGNFDGDHETDHEEYLAGTDPTDPASSLRLTGLRSSTYGPVFDREVSWSSAPGKTYRLQRKVTLTEPWTDLPGDIMTGGPRGTASHLEHHDFAPRTGFYRIQLVE